MGAVLELKDVHVHISGFHILQGVSLAVEEGSVTALLGRNGVGKSTTLKTVMGIYKPSRGTVHYRGEEITGLPTYQITSRGVSYIPSEKNIFASLTVQENLRLAYNGPRDKLQDRLEAVYNLFPELKKFAGARAGQLSGGQQRMLALACGIIRNHSLLLIDEPSEGLSPAYAKSFYRRLGDYVEEHKVSVLLVEQNFALAKEIVDYVYLMDKGVVVDGFPAERIGEKQDVFKRVLGVAL